LSLYFLGTGKILYYCVVCEAPTNNHLYYGAQVCLGCRAFFRRLSIRDKYRNYKCRGMKKGSCQLRGLKMHQQLCQACRYAKCLKVGMQLKKGKEDHYRPLPNPSCVNSVSLVTAEDELIIGHVVGKCIQNCPI